MATKTISLDLEAYERLVRARRRANESFSSVVKRATWPDEARTGGAYLEALSKMPKIDLAIPDELDKDQKEDKPPRNKWR
jgi:hypothetical protein